MSASLHVLKRVCMTQLDRSICLARKMYRFKQSERVFGRDISLFKGLVKGLFPSLPWFVSHLLGVARRRRTC